MSPKDSVGELLLALVDRVSHRGGDTRAVMNEAGITLPQVLFLTRLRQSTQAGGCTASELADRLNMSPPAVSQEILRILCALVLRFQESDGSAWRSRSAQSPTIAPRFHYGKRSGPRPLTGASL